ncbi:MAG: hypothetical protein IT460_06985 [Planctomycetes bacterium]|nr:hypothetical protein [Planctomycetota bacterium]
MRIDLAGGTIDLWPVYLVLGEAVTVNVAFDLPARVRVRRVGGTSVRLVHEDAGVEATRSRATDVDGVDPALALLARVVAAVAPEGGLEVSVSTTSPQGAGLGGSSALAACAVATVATAVGRPLELEAARRLAQDVETTLLRTPTGYQDYYPPLFGGCLALRGGVGGVKVERLPVDLGALARRLRVVYTGVPHHSGLTNWGVLRAFFDGEPATVAALTEIGELSARVAAAVRRGDLDAALALVVAEGAVRRRMAPGVSTPGIEALDAAVRAAGALGTKVCGAGGGGCVLVVLRDEREPAGLAEALRTGGARPIDAPLVAAGLSVAQEARA